MYKQNSSIVQKVMYTKTELEGGKFKRVFLLCNYRFQAEWSNQ